MKRKLVLTSLALLLAIALLASCAGPAPTTPATTTPATTTPATTTPKPTTPTATTPKPTTTTPSPSKPAVMKWNLQNFLVPGSIAYESAVPTFIEAVREMTGGEIEITQLPPGAIAPTFEAFDALGKGAIEMIWDTGIYHMGFMPVGELAWSYPFLLEKDWIVDYFYEDYGGLDLLREAYNEHNVQIVGMIPGLGIYGATLSRVPIKTLADFKGKKIRSFGAYAEILTKLGGSVISVPGEEIYTGLSQGLFDGIMYADVNNMNAVRAHEVAKYYLEPQWSDSGANELLINLDLWNSLSDEHKAILRAAQAELKSDFVRKMRNDTAVLLAEWQQDWGVQVNRLSDADLQVLKGMAEEILAQRAAKDPYNARFIALALEYLKLIGER